MQDEQRFGPIESLADDASNHNALGWAQQRRNLLKSAGVGVGSMALATLLGRDSLGADEANPREAAGTGRHFPAKAKSVIFLFMAGGPSQLDLFTEKTELARLHGEPPPDSFLEGKRFAFLKGTETLLGSPQKLSLIHI